METQDGSGETMRLRERLAGDVDRLQDVFLGLEKSGASTISVLNRPGSCLASARFDVRQHSGRGYWEFLRLAPDLHAIVVNAHYPDPVTIAVCGEDFIEFHFRLSGGLTLVGKNDTIDVGQGTLLVWRQPDGHDVEECLNGHGHRETSVTIYCRRSFIERCFGDLEDGIGPDLRDVLQPSADRIWAIQAALYPALTRLVHDFAVEQDRAGVGLVRAEALATQIITEVLANAVFRPMACAEISRLTDRDVKCLHAARQILVSQHTPPPTIDAVAHRVGLSATKLKLGFRAMFGQTLCDYATDLRMAAAKDLLRKSDRPISQVSAELGYEYQNSFTVAFRRHFGVLPKDYRRDPLGHSDPGLMAAA